MAATFIDLCLKVPNLAALRALANAFNWFDADGNPNPDVSVDIINDWIDENGQNQGLYVNMRLRKGDDTANYNRNGITRMRPAVPYRVWFDA